MAEGTISKIFDKLDGLKEDTAEIKGRLIALETGEQYRKECDIRLGERVDDLEDRVDALEEHPTFLKGSWRVIVVFSSVLTFAITLALTIFFKR